jgi:O-antigen ligase
MSGRAGFPGRAIPVEAGYWSGSVGLVILMMAVVAVRLHEFLPMLAVVKPVVTIAFVSFVLLMSHTSDEVKRRVLAYGQTRRVLAYLVLAAATVPFALWPGEAYNATISLFPGVLLFCAVMMCPPRREVLDRLELALIVLVLIYVGYTLTIGRMYVGRLETVGGFYDSNDMASILAMTFPIAASQFVRAAPGTARLVSGAACVALVLGVTGSGSRGGTLALLAGAVVFALGLKGKRGFLVVVAMLAGGTLAWSMASPTFRARMISLNDLESDYNTTDELGRKQVWKRGRLYWRQNPVLGVGAGNFGTAEGQYFAALGQKTKWSQAHNAYLQAFAELGTIGGVLLVWMLVSAAFVSFPMWRGKTRGRAPPLYRPELLASLAAFAMGATFLSHAFFHPMFAVLALIALADHVRKAESTDVAATAPAPNGAVRAPGERGGGALVSTSPYLRRALNR